MQAKVAERVPQDRPHRICPVSLRPLPFFSDDDADARLAVRPIDPVEADVPHMVSLHLDRVDLLVDLRPVVVEPPLLLGHREGLLPPEKVRDLAVVEPHDTPGKVLPSEGPQGDTLPRKGLPPHRAGEWRTALRATLARGNSVAIVQRCDLGERTGADAVRTGQPGEPSSISFSVRELITAPPFIVGRGARRPSSAPWRQPLPSLELGAYQGPKRRFQIL